MSFFTGNTMTKEEKSRIIADAIASRRGRRGLTDAMLYPLGYRPENNHSCQNCTLARVKDCEVMRTSENDIDCWVGDGRLFVWDDKQE